MPPKSRKPATAPPTPIASVPLETTREVGLDPAEIQTAVEAVLNDPLYWFPVRHHSPTTARHLRAALRARKPAIVFIEGPFEANDLILHLRDPKTVPPVAIYSSYRDDDNVLGLNGIASPAPDIPSRFAVWYPLTAYSPEYVAITTAGAIGAEVVFIDLSHHALIPPARHAREEEPAEGVRPAPGRPAPQDEDQLLSTSGFFERLAEAAGYGTWNEAWDSLFEDPEGTDHEAFRREMATFCCAARQTADPDAERAQGTVARERHFLKVIRETLASRQLPPERAFVVCGGFHLFLDREDTASPPEPPEGTLYTTVVPYSFFRVSEMAGYGAGNRAPLFYQRLFELSDSGRARDLAMEHAIAVLREVRREGDPISTADAIAVTHHATMLARLRGRGHATLDDIDDALMTCCCKGSPDDEGSRLRKAMDRASIGTRIGKVTAALGRLPIVNDFHGQAVDLDLGEALDKEKALRLKLDKREPLDARRSAFLHRLDYLEVPFATQTGSGGDFSGTLFREDWSLRWDPQTEPGLVEKNLYGDTVESAALALLREKLAATTEGAGESARRLLAAVNMDLPELVQTAEDACGRAIDTDAAFVSLVQALRHLGILERHAVFRGLRRDMLDDLLTRCYDRACFAMPDAGHVPDEEHPAVVEAILSLTELVQRSEPDRYDRALFVQAAHRAADETPAPFLRGAFLGLLCEIRELPADALAAEVRGLALAAPEHMVTAGDLVDGMFAVSRTSIMLGADALVAAVDDLLQAAEWDPFLVMLPRLRGAFERLSNPQRDAFAGAVASRLGLSSAVEISQVKGNLAANARIARIDAAVTKALEGWPL